MLLEKVFSIHVSCKDTEKHRDTHRELIILDICLKVSLMAGRGWSCLVNEENGTQTKEISTTCACGPGGLLKSERKYFSHVTLFIFFSIESSSYEASLGLGGAGEPPLSSGCTSFNVPCALIKMGTLPLLPGHTTRQIKYSRGGGSLPPEWMGMRLGTGSTYATLRDQALCWTP
jgi:hypothetical protein